jgi:hypothetical protein
MQGATPQLRAWQPHCILALEGCFLSPRPEASAAARTQGQAGGQAELPARAWWAVVVMKEWSHVAPGHWGMETGGGCGPGKVCPRSGRARGLDLKLQESL